MDILYCSVLAVLDLFDAVGVFETVLENRITKWKIKVWTANTLQHRPTRDGIFELEYNIGTYRYSSHTHFFTHYFGHEPE